MLEFRPFAAKFVETTYEDYSRKHERIMTAPLSADEKTVKNKVDLRRLYPHQHSDEELEERMEKFLTLREKVTRQKQLIRRATIRHEQLKVLKEKEEMERAMETKLARMHFEKQIRLMADTLPPRRTTSSQYSPRLRAVSRPPVTTDNFFSLTAPKAESTQATARLMQPTHTRTKSLQIASDLEGEQHPKRNKLESLQQRLISTTKVSSPAYRSMMQHELSQIKNEAEFSYEAFVDKKSKRRRKIPLYRPKNI
jgi:hypothetical protein